ncbi:hypothetical protein RJ641_003866 [Dillenia turbinata]|uniref:Uncharacterized protein n=1 Tax=Dillenia turbinata TaxID=194707 RepID=A0AAN8VLX1_9MAGN
MKTSCGFKALDAVGHCPCAVLQKFSQMEWQIHLAILMSVTLSRWWGVAQVSNECQLSHVDYDKEKKQRSCLRKKFLPYFGFFISQDSIILDTVSFDIMDCEPYEVCGYWSRNLQVQNLLDPIDPFQYTCLRIS